MRCAVFSSKPYDRRFLEPASRSTGHELHFLESRLQLDTATLAQGFPAVCAFVNDSLSQPVLEYLHSVGVRMLALRSAGYNHVHLPTAERLGISVARVPAYSPYAVAEHSVGMVLSLCRHLHRAYHRVRDNNFSLDGLLGFDLHGKTIGIVGTGAIGSIAVKIFSGFGCQVLMHDVHENPACLNVGKYVSLDELLKNADIVSLHCPLLPSTHHLIDESAIAKMKRGVMLINTSRGALVDTKAVIHALKSGKVGSLGLDVYEEEAELFFEDHSDRVIQDDVFSRLLTFPNVLVTAHQAFFTEDALSEIARVTMHNLTQFERGEKLDYRVAINQ